MDSGPLAEFLAQLGYASAQASVLALAIWLACALLGRHLAPRWRCALWWLVVLRLAWPFSLPSPVSLFNLLAAPLRATPPDWMPFYLPGELAQAALSGVQRPWASALWGGLAGLLLLRAGIGCWVAARIVRRAEPLTNGRVAVLLAQACRTLHLRLGVSLRESAEVGTPCVTGVLHPVLLLPRGLAAELNAEELGMIFLHELAHLRHRDLALNWLLSSVEAVHWFNPLVWLGMAELRAAREEACDAAALAAHPEAARVYGATLLKLVQRGQPLPAAAPTTGALAALGDGGFRRLLHRFQAVVRYRAGMRTWVVGCGAWFILACAGFTDAEPTAPAASAEPPAPLLTDLAPN